jgi:hypothetical protein
MTCHAPGCGAPATHGWQRHATPAELAQAAGNPKVRSVDEHTKDALRQVQACEEHALPADQAVFVHKMLCSAPPVCDCHTDEMPPDAEQASPELVAMAARVAAVNSE